jgi:hypothetical protein
MHDKHVGSFAAASQFLSRTKIMTTIDTGLIHIYLHPPFVNLAVARPLDFGGTF